MTSPSSHKKLESPLFVTVDFQFLCHRHITGRLPTQQIVSDLHTTGVGILSACEPHRGHRSQLGVSLFNKCIGILF